MRYFWLGALCLTLGAAPVLAQNTRAPRAPKSNSGSNPYGSDMGAAKLVRRNLAKQISVQLPENMVEVPEAEIKRRYLMSKPPLAAWYVTNKPIDFTVSVGRTAWKDEDIKLLRDFQKANLRTIYNKIVFRRDEIVTIDKRQFILLEFVGDVTDEHGKNPMGKYNYIAYTVANNSILIFNFNTPAKDEAFWKATADQVMRSIRL